MEAVNIQAATAEAEKPVERKKTADENVKNGTDKTAKASDFFALLHNLHNLTKSSGLEESSGKEAVKNKKTENMKKKVQKNTGEKKTDKKPQLEVRFDEEIDPKLIFPVLVSDDKNLQFPHDRPPSNSVRWAKNTPDSLLSHEGLSLLQQLLQASADGIDEDKLAEMAALAQKQLGRKTGQKNGTVSLERAKSMTKKGGEKDAAAPEVKIPTKKIKVQDFRTVKPAAAEDASGELGVHNAGGERVAAGTESTSLEMDLNLNLSEQFAGLADKTAAPDGVFGEANAAEQPNFSQLLAEQLYNANDGIVQAGKIVLRDGGEGVINLNLQPENLGRVKIMLQLHDGKKLSGKITVDSKEAMTAFQENLNDLIESFEQSGFETMGFELSWNGGGNQQKDFSNERTVFGFADSYDNDIVLNRNDGAAENLSVYEAEAVNVLA